MKAFLAALPLLVAPIVLALSAQAQLTSAQRQQITAWVNEPSFMRLDCDNADASQGNGDANWWDQGETSRSYFGSSDPSRDATRFLRRFAKGPGHWIHGKDRDVLVFSKSSGSDVDPTLWMIYEKAGAHGGNRRLIEVGGTGRLPGMEDRVERFLVCLHGKQKNLTLLMND